MRAALSRSPLFVFRNTGAFDNPASQGGFAWNAPEVANAGDPEALRYLERFYDRAQRSPERFVMGSVYKGFDDSRASWGQGKRIPENCGQTWPRHLRRDQPFLFGFAPASRPADCDLELGEVGAAQTSFDLRETSLQPGDWLLVKAQAKAGMVDGLSDPVQYRAYPR